MDGTFDVEEELLKIRHFREVRRHRRYIASKLTPFRSELIALRRAGASYAELAIWLQKVKRQKVAVSTVQRFITKLPEFVAVNVSEKSGEDGQA